MLQFEISEKMTKLMNKALQQHKKYKFLILKIIFIYNSFSNRKMVK